MAICEEFPGQFARTLRGLFWFIPRVILVYARDFFFLHGTCISPALSAQNVRHERVEPRYKPCAYVLSRVHASAVPDFQEKALSFLSPCNFTR